MQVQRSSGYCSSLCCIAIAKECKSPARALRGHVRPLYFASRFSTRC